MNYSHILIIEDDAKIRKFLRQFLSSHSYIISDVDNLNEANKIVGYFKFDLIILDIMLGGSGGTGFDFIERHKESLNVPIIILSAMGHVDDRVYGLESGARDYISKPFEPRELLIRVKNLISQVNKPQTINFGNFIFDFDSKILFQNDQTVHLTQSERNLLEIFCRKSKNVITRDDLLKAFTDLNIRTIDTMITRLRSKIEADPKSPRFIITERNQGYSFWP